MNFKQLEAFVSVVKNRSFSRAAEEIYLSQPTVSSYIQALENECGVRLLMRSTKEVCLTQAGTVFFQYAAQLLQMRQQALASVNQCSEDICGTLEITASTVPSQYMLPAVLSRMAAEYPELSFSLREYDSSEVVRRIAAMEAEIGIIGTRLNKNACICQPFARDRLVIITPNTPDYQALQGKFPLDRLTEEPFLMRESGSGTRWEMEEALIRAGLDPTALKPRAQLNGTESIKQAVSQGLGISIVSRVAAEDYARFGLLLMFDPESPAFDRQFYFVYRKNWILSPAAEALMATARQIFSAGNSPA